MRLTKKKIGLIGMGFAVATILVLAIIGASWLTTEIKFHLDRLTSDTIFVECLIFAFVVFGCLYSIAFITIYDKRGGGEVKK